MRACDVLVMLVVKSSIFYHKATCHNCAFAAAAHTPKEISRPARPLLIHRQPKDEEAAHT